MNIVFVSGRHNCWTTTAKAVFEYFFCKWQMTGYRCIDAGCQYEKRQLDRADLVVVLVDGGAVLYSQFMGAASRIQVPVIYVCGNAYSEGGDLESLRRRILKEYRLDDVQFGMMPYNARLQNAVIHGQLSVFLKSAEQADTSENDYFYREMMRNVFRAVKVLERK